MEQIAGHCGKCGAPYFMQTFFHGIVPPTPRPTCACWVNEDAVVRHLTRDVDAQLEELRKRISVTHEVGPIRTTKTVDDLLARLSSDDEEDGEAELVGA